MKKGTKHCNIPIFLPELACPHRCVFCNQENISSTHSIPSENDVKNTIESHLQTIPKGTDIEIAFFGGSFTGLDIEIQEKYLTIAHTYVRSKQVNGIRLSTRPDYINTKILETLKNYGVTEIELGAQSFNKDVLRLSGRGHNKETIRIASKQIKEHGFKLGLQMMIGLPGDSLELSIDTAKSIIDCGADSCRIYPTLVIANTPLAELYKQGLYKPLSLEESIEWCSEIYPLFIEKNITVLRIGLHPNKDFDSKDILLDGPFHASFKELVLTQIWKKRFQKELPKTKGKLSILVSPENIPHAIGFNSSNKISLQNTYGWIQIKANSNILHNEFTYSYY